MSITVRVQFNGETTVVVRVHVVAVRVLRMVVTRLTEVGVGGLGVTKETAVVVTVTVTVSSAGSIPAGEAMAEQARAKRPSNLNKAMISERYVGLVWPALVDRAEPKSLELLPGYMLYTNIFALEMMPLSFSV